MKLNKCFSISAGIFYSSFSVLYVIVSTNPISARSTQSTAAFSFYSIMLIKFMSIFTMCFSIIYSRPTISAKNVFFKSNNFKMIDIYASSVFAKMIYLKSWWDFPFFNFVSKSVNKIFFIINHYFAVTSSFVYIAINKASGFAIDVISFPKTFFCVFNHIIFNKTLSLYGQGISNV